MNLRHRGSEGPEINLTPLIDVVFLLLIFFMVSTTFQRDAELTIDLPESTSEEKSEKRDPIEIAIDLKGAYYINGVGLVNTQLSTLKQAISKAAGSRKAPPLVINADANTPHQAVITVMDAARQLGLVHLSFTTRQTEKE